MTRRRDTVTPESSQTASDVKKTDAEWKQSLTPEQYHVLREAGTEPPGSSELLDEHRPGMFRCKGCGAPLFSSDTKFQSGSGWPSFYAAVDGAVDTGIDASHFMVRTEIRCHTCGGHLGHVFEDGPRPTGLRYCTNGLALTFEPS
jgi:peptide-methionine (R)-S-oxide reductase